MRRLVLLVALSAFGVITLALVAGPLGDGASATLDAAATYEDFLPAWSPDGRYIAFVRETKTKSGDYNDSVYLVAVKSGQQRRFLAGGSAASFSPDGTRLAISRYIAGDVLTIKLDGTGRKRLAADGSYPLWSPDGRNILFERLGPSDTDDFWLYVVPAAGGKARNVARPGSDADWSPDGTRIAYGTGDLMLGSVNRVGVVDSAGRASILLGPGGDPSWSADGREIAFTVTSGDDETEGVFLSQSEGANRRFLTTGSSPEFSPDGQQIAYARGNSLWIMNRNGSNPRRLTHPGGDFNRAWSPDGHSLAFQRSDRIWLVNSDGRHERQLTHG